MSVLRFTPPTSVGPFSTTTEGLYTISSNWSPAKAPGAGDTALITYGTLDVINTTIDGVSIFAISTANSSSVGFSLQSTRLGAGTTLVLDSRALTSPIQASVSFNFENDGVIDILGQANLSSFAGSASIVNKGTLNLYDGFLNTSASIENDGVITVSNASLTAFATPITGSGSIVLKPGSRVETTANVGSGQKYTFVGGAQGNSVLQVDSPSSFRSVISGFAASDQIILKTGSATGVSSTYVPTGSNSGTLIVTSNGTSASLNFVGSNQISDFTVSGTTAGTVVTTSRGDQGVANTSPVYRFFDSTNGTHFFTSSASERDEVASTTSSLIYEGVGLTATDPNGKSATAVYRFFDSNYGTHFYTASAAERDAVIASRADLKFEGTGFYADSSQQAGDSPVFRFFDTNYGTHFYTANAQESANIQATRSDLKYEGISFYSAS